jgi:hypothetical protein
MFNILLVGAGQLGSRHLQGLCKLNGKNSIYIVDPLKESLELSEQRLNEITEKNSHNSYTFMYNYDGLPEKIDLAIISTNSDVRFNVFNGLSKKLLIKNIIFEKFLFQTEDEYYNVEKILNEKNINAWVNCTRRMYPEFKILRENLLNKNILEISVRGYNWSLGSNAIHFIDIISFLSNSDEYTITDNFLFNHISKNKRIGFIEFNGRIKGHFKNNTQFNITCFPGETTNLEIEILLEDAVYLIKQIEEKLITQRKIDNNWIIEEKEFRVHFQSNLTNRAVEQILIEGKCDLPTYQESMKLHLPLLKVFIGQLKKIENGKEIERCQIT